MHELALPLRDASVIRQEAAEKHIDPALIAAVIYAETKFDPRTSSAGAQGLMQILPAPRSFSRKLLGRHKLPDQRPGDAEVNIAYGSYYLRYLLDHYEGNEMLAVAAYNAGLANVDGWVARAHARGRRTAVERDPVPGDACIRAARAERAACLPRTYARQLGLR